MKSVFVDTNVFLYRIDLSQPSKRQLANQTITNASEGLVISTQVLQEFYNTAVQKFRLPPSDALLGVQELCKRKVVQVSAAIVIGAIDTSERYRISFWDALIVEAAVAGNCGTLFTEDLNHGQKIRGVLIQNPFL